MGRSPEGRLWGGAPSGRGNRGRGLEPGRPSAVGALGTLSPAAGAGRGQSCRDGGRWSACGHRQGAGLCPAGLGGHVGAVSRDEAGAVFGGRPASTPTRREGRCHPPCSREEKLHRLDVGACGTRRSSDVASDTSRRPPRPPSLTPVPWFGWGSGAEKQPRPH